MLHINSKQIKRFFSELDKCTADETRPTLQTFHVLSTHDRLGQTVCRLCATNGHILVICDVDQDVLDFACVQLILFKKTSPDGNQTSYVTIEKHDLCSDDLFPYPDVMCVIPNLTPALTHPGKIIGLEYMNLALRIREAYNDEKKNKYPYFLPNYTSQSQLMGDVYVEKGLFIYLMPVRTRLIDKYLEEEILPINEYLPGFLPEKIPEEKLEIAA